MPVIFFFIFKNKIDSAIQLNSMYKYILSYMHVHFKIIVLHTAVMEYSGIWNTAVFGITLTSTFFIA